MMSNDAIRTYYTQFAEQEWLRLLDLDQATTKFRMTTQMLRQYLPASGRVLDLGGGSGRYTIWLAQQGYRVVLADQNANLFEQVHSHLDKAQVNSQVEALVTVDRYDLSQWPEGAFDAVLCLGPFYRMVNLAERTRVAREIGRILQPGGVAFVDFLPQYMLLQQILAALDATSASNAQKQFEQIVEQGALDSEALNRLARAYGAHPAEITPFFTQLGFTMLTLVAGEGNTQEMRKLLTTLAKQDQRILRIVADALIRMISDPSLLGATTHLLYIGRRPG